ncbi:MULTISPECIES: YhcN/YlaJ family sporulation lipoprotein [unclassified Virgibacillus]|uniref:YhcN/YlaJ family sporulation lipoprotein n=1 Tax=unclassified Virgibacillus TaxID=2620237 RepID=UPI0024DE6013|nr:YhcN/YlaJ family sporulation lipoprotein [Virgibacillus sp. LDC-1]
MKWKFFSILTVLMIALLVACQGNTNTNDQGANDNPNVDPTRYNANDGNKNYTMDGETGNRNRADNRNNMTHYEVAKEAADRITNEVPEIDHAYVLTTNNNAYVAATMDDNRNNKNGNNNGNMNNRAGMDNGGELTDKVKKKVADIVQSVDNDIDNVYVSTNPDFVDLTNNYVDDMNNGRPVEGFFDQMGNMIERIFPQNKR